MKQPMPPEQSSLARFRKEFVVLQGGDPFPWQERLFLQFCAGEIPAALDLPTGLGKTSVMPIWLMARALAPDAARKKIPRRLAYIVDRRVVVDQATTEAEKLREWLEKSGTDLKPALNIASTKLPISTLRGQLADNREWQEHPAACAIVVGTVDMIGSRSLFSGYGVSPKMRPYHAGLLGADTLVILDEAHLVPPFEALLRAIECDPNDEFKPEFDKDREIVPGFRLMCLSATGAHPSDPNRVFSLTDEDYEHKTVRERLGAPKHLTIDEEATNETLAERLAARAWTLATDPAPARVLVYCDRREDALKIVDQIEKLAGRKTEFPIGLLVGERRVREREGLYDWLKHNYFIGPAPGPPDAPTFLVATSAGEVGVDLDADHVACDLVEWERMVQRFGRVNRRGRKQSRIEVMPAAAKDKKKGADDWEKRLPQLLAPLNELPVLEGSRDASPGAIAQLRAKSDLQRLLQKAESHRPLYPALTRALIEAWAMTSIEQHRGRPDIKPWLRGWEEDDEPQSIIAWRKFLPLRRREKPSKEDIDDFFEAAPLELTEMLETETWRAVDWIVARAMATARSSRKSELNRNQNLPEADTMAVLVLDGKGRFERHYALADLAELERKENRKAREIFGDAIRNRTLVVCSHLGGLDSRGMLSEQHGEQPRTIEDLERWGTPLPFRVRTTELTAPEHKDWREFYRFAVDRSDDGTETRWIVVEQPCAQGQTQESLAVARKEQRLDEHQDEAAAAARRLAQVLELPAPYDEMLALAAKLHDEGKNTMRWQRAFKAPPDKLCAKTKGPVNLRLLDGYRHEFGSLLCAEGNAELAVLPPEVRDLALHLIAAHHGNARPLISARSCEIGPPSRLQGKAGEAALRFGRLQKQWGPWGLAWWEALLRSVDQQVSRENDALEERAIEKLKVEETV